MKFFANVGETDGAAEKRRRFFHIQNHFEGGIRHGKNNGNGNRKGLHNSKKRHTAERTAPDAGGAG